MSQIVLYFYIVPWYAPLHRRSADTFYWYHINNFNWETSSGDFNMTTPPFDAGLNKTKITA